MATLTIHCEDAPLAFISTNVHSKLSQASSIHDVESILDINGRPVWNVSSGRLFSSDSQYEQDSGLPVIIKVAEGDDEDACRRLKAEADFYAKQLEPLQGRVVPICYGLFVTTARPTAMYVLVLQHCGEPLDEPFEMLDPDLRYSDPSTFG